MNKKVLIVDIGNTAVEFAVFNNGNLQDFLGFFRFSDQLEDVKKGLNSYKKQQNLLDDAMIFSVVPKTEKLVSPPNCLSDLKSLSSR